MSRQGDRAAARQDAKIRRHDDAVAERIATRKRKGLTALSTIQATDYPKSRHEPFSATGKRYPHSNKRQQARYERQAAHAA